MVSSVCGGNQVRSTNTSVSLMVATQNIDTLGPIWWFSLRCVTHFWGQWFRRLWLWVELFWGGHQIYTVIQAVQIPAWNLIVFTYIIFTFLLNSVISSCSHVHWNDCNDCTGCNFSPTVLVSPNRTCRMFSQTCPFLHRSLKQLFLSAFQPWKCL